MKKIIKNILTTIVVITIVISSSGIQVYRHSCTLHSFSAISIVSNPECDKDDQVMEKQDDCCNDENISITENDCCDQKPVLGNHQKETIYLDKLNCCVSSIQDNQVPDNFFPPVDNNQLIVCLYVPVISVIENNNFQHEQNLLFENNDLPPPKYGKVFLQSIHQLKLDTPVS